MKILAIVGTRPQFVKLAAIHWAVEHIKAEDPKSDLDLVVLHTGQHHDYEMSDIFFKRKISTTMEKLPRPRYRCEIHGGTNTEQLARSVNLIAKCIQKTANLNMVLVFGDSNSALAGSIAAAQQGIQIGHVEAGLRTGDKTMPEEINRVVADHLASIHFCPTVFARRNLEQEGITTGILTGDVMYDCFLDSKKLLKDIARPRTNPYYLVTLHRAKNVDDPDRLRLIWEALSHLERPIIWPIHPRTSEKLNAIARDLPAADNIDLRDSVDHFKMLTLAKHAEVVITDSGGLQKEAYWLNTSCVILRPVTEWQVLLELRAAVLSEPQDLVSNVKKMEKNRIQKTRAKYFGHGSAAQNILKAILLREPLDIKDDRE